MSSEDAPDPLLSLPDEPEPGARPSTTPFGDGRDGAPPLTSAAWICASAAVLLLLPRQWWAAGIAGLFAAVFALIQQRRRRGASGKPSTS